MRKRRAVVIVAMALAASAGCTLLTSTDGLSGSAPASEGGAADTAPTETGPLVEGGADADADAATGPFCASLSPQPRFCADFDMGALTDYGSPANAVSLDTAIYKSPQRSLLSTVAGNAPQRYSELDRFFGESPSTYEGSFDILVDAYDASRDVELVTLQLTQAGGKSCRTTVSIRGSVWHFDESCEAAGGASVYGISNDSHITAAIGRWVHIDFAVSLVAPRTLSLTIDGTKGIDGLTPNAALTTGSMRLVMGIAYLQLNATGSTIHLDNVRFDYK